MSTCMKQYSIFSQQKSASSLQPRTSPTRLLYDQPQGSRAPIGDRFCPRGGRGSLIQHDCLNMMNSYYRRGPRNLAREIIEVCVTQYYNRRNDRIPHCTIDLGDLYTESGQTLQGSFSAVSKPTDFCNQILVGKLSLRSTKYTPFYSSQISTVLVKILLNAW